MPLRFTRLTVARLGRRLPGIARPICVQASDQMKNVGNFASIFVSSAFRTEVLQPK